jgi:hypothetical protein
MRPNSATRSEMQTRTGVVAVMAGVLILGLSQPSTSFTPALPSPVFALRTRSCAVRPCPPSKGVYSKDTSVFLGRAGSLQRDASSGAAEPGAADVECFALLSARALAALAALAATPPKILTQFLQLRVPHLPRCVPRRPRTRPTTLSRSTAAAWLATRGILGCVLRTSPQRPCLS